MEHLEGNEQQFSIWHLYLFGFFSLVLLKWWLFYWRPSGSRYYLSCLVIILLRLLKQSFSQNHSWLSIEDKMDPVRNLMENLYLYASERVNFSASWLSCYESWFDFFHGTILCFNTKFENWKSFSENCALSVFDISLIPDYWKRCGFFFLMLKFLNFNKSSEILGSGQIWYQLLESSSLSASILFSHMK